jgi:succinoglycan biosynthesis protein ExoM
VICSICIATYKRPELLDRLLTSLDEQVLPDNIELEILVVDNDCDGSAAPVIARHDGSKQVSFHYFLQPLKNISMARNMAVANARGAYLLFIDDDERATPGWIRALLEAASQYRADVVFGPVFPDFDNDAPEWIRKRGRLLVDTIPKTPTGTEAQGTWTGNCLVKASILKDAAGPFNPEYGNTGGEDTELFNRLKRRGARLIYCNEAGVFEYWPLSRTRLSYLLKRGLTGGNIHTRRAIAFARRKGTVRLAMLAKAVTFGFLSLALSMITFPSRLWRTYWQMKLAANVGRFMAVVGQHYRSYS